MRHMYLAVAIVVMMSGVCLAETYEKANDNEIKVNSMEATLPINGKPVKATLESVVFAREQVEADKKDLASKLAQFETQVLDLRAKYTADGALIDARLKFCDDNNIKVKK